MITQNEDSARKWCERSSCPMALEPGKDTKPSVVTSKSALV